MREGLDRCAWRGWGRVGWLEAPCHGQEPEDRDPHSHGGTSDLLPGLRVCMPSSVRLGSSLRRPQAGTSRASDYLPPELPPEGAVRDGKGRDISLLSSLEWPGFPGLLVRAGTARDGRRELLNRYRTLKSYRGFESPSLRQLLHLAIELL